MRNMQSETLVLSEVVPGVKGGEMSVSPPSMSVSLPSHCGRNGFISEAKGRETRAQSAP